MGVLIVQEKDQRSLDLNTAKCMLGLLLGKTWPLFPVFNQFLEVSSLVGCGVCLFCFLRKSVTEVSWSSCIYHHLLPILTLERAVVAKKLSL